MLMAVEVMAQETIEIFMPYKPIIHTITGDNGKEFAEHKTIAKTLGIEFYFAHPYHSWERGANPKGSSFDHVTDADIQQVQDILNNRPRKKLKFLTPNEFLSINLSNSKVALVT